MRVFSFFVAFYAVPLLLIIFFYSFKVYTSLKMYGLRNGCLKSHLLIYNTFRWVALLCVAAAHEEKSNQTKIQRHANVLAKMVAHLSIYISYMDFVWRGKEYISHK